MADTLGIVAEYNPFHSGHLHHIHEAKRLSSADNVVVVMSGDFVQRGEPSVTDKYQRAKTAVSCGADLIIELPFVYAVGGVELFAGGAVRLLNGLGIVDTISFGMESIVPGQSSSVEETKELLAVLARYLAFEPGSFGETLHGLSCNMSYPAAREKAVSTVIGKRAASLLQNPNDSLAVEYLIAMTKLHAAWQLNITDVLPIARKGAGLGEIADGFAGATAIRDLLRGGRFDDAKIYLPKPEQEVYAGKLVFMEDLFEPVIYSLLTMHDDEAQSLYAASEGLHNRLISASMKAKSMEELICFTKSKRYTRTRVERLILHALMGLTKADVAAALTEPLYARVLAFNEKGAKLIRRSKRVQADLGLDVQFITSVSRQKDVLAKSPVTNSFDVRAAKMYTMLRDGNLESFRYSPNPKG